MRRLTIALATITQLAAVSATAAPLAAQSAAPAGASPAVVAIGDSGPEAPAVEIAGFRSAQFGATETEVRAAIAKDFHTDSGSIRAGTNPVERTRVLAATADNVLPDSGKAEVAYILGAKTKRLIQVNIVWHAANDQADMNRVVNDANVLRDYFVRKGSYAKGSLAANAKLPDGSVLVFRGADAKGHLILLHLVLKAEQAKGAKPARVDGATLILSYVEDPKAPDVFTLSPSAF